MVVVRRVAAWERVSISLRRVLRWSSRVVRDFWAARMVGSVRLDGRGCLRMGVERVVEGFAVGFGGGEAGDTEGLMVCARVLGVYGVVLIALRLSISGTLVVDDFLKGDTNGLASVLVALLSLRRLTASGEDMVVCSHIRRGRIETRRVWV